MDKNELMLEIWQDLQDVMCKSKTVLNDGNYNARIDANTLLYEIQKKIDHYNIMSGGTDEFPEGW